MTTEPAYVSDIGRLRRFGRIQVNRRVPPLGGTPSGFGVAEHLRVSSSVEDGEGSVDIRPLPVACEVVSDLGAGHTFKPVVQQQSEFVGEGVACRVTPTGRVTSCVTS